MGCRGSMLIWASLCILLCAVAAEPIVPTNYTPTFQFLVEYFRRISGDEITQAASRNWKYGGNRLVPIVPRTCLQPTTFNAHNSATGITNDLLFQFDLFTYDPSNSVGGYTIWLDLNIKPVNTETTKSNVYVGIVDSAGTFVGFRRDASIDAAGNALILGFNVIGSVSGGKLTINDTDLQRPPECKCGASARCTACPTVEQSFSAYVSLPANNSNLGTVAAGGYSRLYTFAESLFTHSIAAGNVSVAVFAEFGEAQFEIMGVQAFVKLEAFRSKSRVFSGIYTGAQLYDWYTNEVVHLSIPKTNNGTMPYLNPYVNRAADGTGGITVESPNPRDDSNCVANVQNHLVLNGTSTTLNQFQVQDTLSLQEEFELSLYFPLISSGTLTINTDALVTVHTMSKPSFGNLNTRNRLFVGITEGEVSDQVVYNLVGATRQEIGSRMATITWSKPFYSAGFINITRTGSGGGGITFRQTKVDKYGRASLYLRRGAVPLQPGLGDFYSEYPLNTTGIPNLFTKMTDWTQRIIQSASFANFNSSDLYSWAEAFIADPQDQTLAANPAIKAARVQSFLSGGTLSYLSGNQITNRRLNTQRTWGLAAFQSIGRYGATENQTSPAGGEVSSFAAFAIAVDAATLGCARDGSTLRYDVCGICGGNAACADCAGIVNGTTVYDACGECGGTNSSCKDCKGVINGTSKYDACGICGGKNNTCLDCRGVPKGTTRYDACGVCGGKNTTCLDCKGIPNGTFKYDACGVCGGDNTTCIDCKGTPKGTFKYDACGICGGKNSTCLDCKGVPKGTHKYDACGVCGGTNSSCLDCKGIPNGTFKYDACGICGGKNNTCLDCRGVPKGTTRYDACGVCGGKNTTCLDCKGIPNGTFKYDACGVCGGNNSTCIDCKGTPKGTFKYDACGVCGGRNNTCLDCRGVPKGTTRYDACGVCGGTNTSCRDCKGIPNGTFKYDSCGVCGGDNTTCLDCKGTPKGTFKYDSCGVCGGDNTTCLDCKGVPKGTLKYDACGVCGGDNTTCLDCKGTPKGTFKYDACGVCGGDNKTCTDCFEVVLGTSRLDACGYCGGDNSSCTDCRGVLNGTCKIDDCGVCCGNNKSCCLNYLGVQNHIWDWMLLRASISDIIETLERLYAKLDCTAKSLPDYDPAICDGNRRSGRSTLERLAVRDMVGQHSNFLLNCLKVFSNLVTSWIAAIDP